MAVFHGEDSSSESEAGGAARGARRGEEDEEEGAGEARNKYKLVNVCEGSDEEDQEELGEEDKAAMQGDGAERQAVDAEAAAAAAAAAASSAKRPREEDENNNNNNNNDDDDDDIQIVESNESNNDAKNDAIDDDDDEEEEFGAVNGQARRQSGGAFRYFEAPTCRRCGEKGHMQAECLQAPAARSCLLCGETGHEQKDCPQIICYKCGRTGHLSRDCTSSVGVVIHEKLLKPRRRVNFSELRSVVCMQCFKLGHVNCHQTSYSKGLEGQSRSRVPNGSCSNCAGAHFDESCPEPRASEQESHGAALATCYNCGQQGHIAAMCPRPSSRGRRRSAPSGSYYRQPTGFAGSRNQSYGKRKSYGGESYRRDSKRRRR